MKRNISNPDKYIRILLAILIAVLISTKLLVGTWAIVLGIFAAVLLVTAFINFCPIWAAFGINTFKKKKSE